MEEFFGVVPCTLMSMMSNMLMSSACEVDIMGTVAMYAMAQAGGKPSALVDWNNNYGEDPDKGVVFHCSNLPKDVFVEEGEGKPVMDFQEIIAGTVGKENTYGTVVGRVKASPFTYLRVSTDDAAGKIRAYIGEGELTNDPLKTFGGYGVVRIPNFQKLLALHLRQRLRTSRRHQPDARRRRGEGSPGQISRLGRLPARLRRVLAVMDAKWRCAGFRYLKSFRIAAENQEMSTRYTIGLDYGTNSVRALIVNVANGAEVATAVWGYEHGTQGVILARDPNLARQHPADYVKGADITIRNALAAAKKNIRGFKRRPGRRHRRGHHGQHAVAGGCQRPAAGFQQKIRPRPRSAWRGCGKTIPAWPRRRKSRNWPEESARAISPNAAGPIPANGSGARSCIVCEPARRFSTLPIPGWNWRIMFPPCSPARKPRPGSPRAFAPPAIRRCTTTNWGGYPDEEFLSQLASQARRFARPARLARSGH